MITVLGAGGFVGRRLVSAYTAGGLLVYAPHRDDPEIFTRALGDVYYCIGKTANYANDPVATFDAHSAYLVRILQQANFDRVIYLSSTRLYDGLAEGSEDSALRLCPLQQRHLYDLTKALGEHFVCLHSGGRGIVARLACVYDSSPDANGFLPELLQRLSTEKTLSLKSSPLAARDYVHVDDVVSGLQLMMKSGKPGQIYNVASGENVSNEAIAKILKAHGWEVQLTDLQSKPAKAPRISIDKLAALGWHPRTVQLFITEHASKVGSTCAL